MKTANLFAHVDDGTLGFNSRDYLIMGTKITFMVMPKWRLTAHAGCDGKQSKTEMMLFPSTKNLKEWRKVQIGVNVERMTVNWKGNTKFLKRRNMWRD